MAEHDKHEHDKHEHNAQHGGQHREHAGQQQTQHDPAHPTQHSGQHQTQHDQARPTQHRSERDPNVSNVSSAEGRAVATHQGVQPTAPAEPEPTKAFAGKDELSVTSRNMMGSPYPVLPIEEVNFKERAEEAAKRTVSTIPLMMDDADALIVGREIESRYLPPPPPPTLAEQLDMMRPNKDEKPVAPPPQPAAHATQPAPSPTYEPGHEPHTGQQPEQHRDHPTPGHHA
jgi:hypothetical protein